MAWTSPTTRSTGNLITASIWNTDLVNNLSYLKNAPTFDGLITVSGAGTSAFSAASSTGVAVRVTNSTSGTTAYAQSDLAAGTAGGGMALYSQGYSTSNYSVAAGLTVFSTGAGGINIAADNGSGAIKFYTGGSTLRWGINAAGDHTVGTSSHIADSVGTPSINSGPASSTIRGTDYAFELNVGTAGSTGFTIDFGHTWSTAPIYTITTSRGTLAAFGAISLSTTQISINGTWLLNELIQVHCRSY